jgi:BirA family transcriptional regulator, biotin operon repressor / biotin---[acetyl-CoA-carboxylase] ligase
VILLRPRLPAAFKLISRDVVGSTNDEAKRLASAGAEEGTLVWALEQTAGRGRRGRSWVSPRGNLYASLVLRPGCSADRAAQLGFVAALAVGGALGSICERLEGLAYKWPNDVLIHGSKIAGILLESLMGGGNIPEFVIVGVGVNLASSPRETEFPATSIAEQGLPAVSSAQALEAFCRHYQIWAQRWREAGFAPIREAWLARARFLGEPIRVRLDTATLHGRFLDLDQHGALVIEMAGETRRFSAGEIFPADG